MDEWSRVRDLAPDTDVAADDIAAARRRLTAQIARAPRAVRARNPRTNRTAIAVAVAIVAVIATSAVLITQWMPRPAPQLNSGQLDLSEPLREQVPDGSYLRIATTTETAYVAEIPTGEGEQTRIADGHLRIRSTSTAYVPRTDGAWLFGWPEEPAEVIERSGPDAQALIDGRGWATEPTVYRSTDNPVVDPQWLTDLPTDPDGILLAYAERFGMRDPGAPVDPDTSLEPHMATMLAGWLITDVAWLLASPTQREDLLDTVRSVDDVTVTDRGDTILVEFAGMYASTATIDTASLLPLRGTAVADPVVSGRSTADLPPDTWSTEITIVDVPPEPRHPDDDDFTSRCNGTTIPGSAFGSGLRPDELNADGQAALSADGVPALNPEEWFLVSQTADTVVLMSFELHGEVLTPGLIPSGLPGPTHELLTLSREDGQWRLADWENCVLEQVRQGYDNADVELDPAFALTPDATALHFLVTERACNSGQTAEGRVELVEKAEFEDAVEVYLAIRPADGPADCQGNPPTPFVVELDEPLGDRRISDLTYMEIRTLRE